MTKRAAALLFWSLAALTAGMLAALVLVLGGIIPVDPPSDRGDAGRDVVPPLEAVPQPSRINAPARSTAAKRPLRPPPVTRASSVESTVVVLSATRGDSWFSARVGSESGRVLDERVLARGESVRLRGERIWLAVGAAGHVDVTVNGTARPIAPGTVELVLAPPRGPG
jgi:hypothetical protein